MTKVYWEMLLNDKFDLTLYRHHKPRNQFIFLWILISCQWLFFFSIKMHLCCHCLLTSAATVVPSKCGISYPYLVYEWDVQSIIIRSLMVNSLVVINGGQIPGCPRHCRVQIQPGPAPPSPGRHNLFFCLVDCGTSSVQSNALGCIARAGNWPTPESLDKK